MSKIDPDRLNLEERVVSTNKVQKTTKGGRNLSWSALVVVGDNDGHVGVGLGHARAIPEAIRKGVEAAKKSLILVPRIEKTIPHAVNCHNGASHVVLRPASPGTGVVAGGPVRAVLELAGVHDVLSKNLGSANPINSARVTMKALGMLRSPEDVARLRGLSLEEMLPRRRGGNGAHGEA